MSSKKSWFITLLVGLFGTGSWIAITGLWLEMPLLIARLPESWRLPSRLNTIIQLANLGPLAYWAALKLRLANDISGTYAQLIVGLISCAVLIFGWQTTVSIGGGEHSIVLMICTFGLALVDCTSSVTFLTFMARFDSVYMAPYLVGEGLSGLVPMAVAFAQGVGEDHQSCSKIEANVTSKNSTTPLQFEPRFSIDVFFLSLLITISVSLAAFGLLHQLPYCKRHRRAQKDANENEIEMSPVAPNRNQPGSKCSKKSKMVTYYIFLALMCWNCFTTFGFFPAIQPYSALPYGNQTMHSVVLLSGLSYPAGCFLAMLTRKASPKLIYLTSLLGSLFGAYIVVCALMSPLPPLVGTTFGELAIVASWILFTLILSYSKTLITVWICDYNAQEGMFWVGMATQAGAAAGAGLNFALVNWVSGLFNEC